MKIKRHDEMELLIEDFSLFPGIFTVPTGLFMLWKLGEHLYPNPRFDTDTAGMTVGILMMFFATALFNEKRVFRFDLGKQELEWRRAGLLGRKRETVPFSAIRNVVTQTSNSDRTVLYRLALITDTGEVPLNRSYDAGDKEVCETVGLAIRSVLKKSTDTGRMIEDSIIEMVRSGKKIDAVSLAREYYGMSLTEAKAFVDGLE